MARSQLLQTLQNLAGIHAEAFARQVEVAQVRGERALAGPNRRRFLEGVGAMAGAALLSKPSVARAGAMPKIIIIGAGISGLNAALTLQDAGVPATIYEASYRIGGRMHSDTTTWADAQTSEWCGEFLDSGHVTMRKLAHRFALPIVDTIKAEPMGSIDTLFVLGQNYPLADADRDFEPVYATLRAQIKEAPSTTYNSYTAFGKQLDALSIYEWIDLYVPGGHTSRFGSLLDTAYNQEFGQDTRRQSSLNLVYLLGFQPSATTKPRKLYLYGISDQRYRIVGGNQSLPQAMAASLPDGAIKRGCRLTGIEARPGGDFALRFDSGDDRQIVLADHVILTLPFSVLRGLDFERADFDARKRKAINELGYGANSKLMLQFDERYWNELGSGGSIYTDLKFQNTWEASSGSPGASGILVAYTGGRNGRAFNAAQSAYASAATDPAVNVYAKDFLAELETVFPGISAHWNQRAILSTPWRDPNLLGSYSCWLVGQYTGFAGYERVRQGNCHFAGEHCSLNFQGYMEGGADEGARAAREILADLKA